MENLSKNEKAFIRPTPSSGALGGVANKTKETILLCEAAGFNITLVETVGVGQSEHDVANIVDFFLLLMLPGGGDELQGIKKGILEVANLIIVNKEDLNKQLAQTTQQEYQNALRILSTDENALPVLTCSAQNKTGLDKIWELTNKRLREDEKSGSLTLKRTEQEIKWLDKLVLDGLKMKLESDQNIQKIYSESLNDIRTGKTTAFLSAERILNRFFS